MNALLLLLSRPFHAGGRAVVAAWAVITLVLFLPAGLPAQWSQTNGPYGANARTLLVNGSTLYAGTSTGVFRSTNNGTSWTAGGLISNDVYSLAAIGAGLFAGTSNGVWVSSDNGTTWNGSGLGLLTVSALAVMGTNLFAGTSGSAVFLSRDGGATWTGVSSTLPDSNITALAVIGTILFAGSNFGFIYGTADNGSTWTDVSSALASVLDIYSLAVNGTTLYAGTNDGVWRTTDNGGTWNGAGLGNTIIYSLAPSGTGMFAGTADGVCSSTSGTTPWTLVSVGRPNTRISSLAVMGTSIFAGTNRSGVFLSTNSGSSWSAVNAGLMGTFIWGLAASPVPGGTGPKGLFAATNDGVSLSPDDGSTWYNMYDITVGLPSTTIYTLAISDTTLYAGTSGYGAYSITLSSSSWISANNGLPATSNVRAFTSGGSGVNLFAATDGDGVFLSTNHGASWSAVSIGLPANPRVLALATTPAAAGTTPNLFAGIYGTGVYRSTNNGGIWTVASNGLPAGAFVYALAVVPPSGGTGSSNLFAGTFGTGAFLSTNDGASWTAVTGLPSGAYVISFSVSGTTLYAGVSGGVYASTNNGATWTADTAGMGDRHTIRSLAASSSALFAGTTRGVWSESKAAIPPVYPSQYTLANTISIPSHSGASAYSTTDYRLVGLPGNSQFGVQVLFPTYYKNELNYRVSWDNGLSSDYIVRYNGTSTFTFTTGRAFWVIGDGPITLNINVATAPLTASREAVIPLQSGWNLITNPFINSITWPGVQAYNGISEPIYGFTGAYATSQTFDPFVGYYYYNANAAAILKVPYSLVSGTVTGQASDPAKWRIGIRVSDGVVSDNTASFGVVAQAPAQARTLNYHTPRLLEGGISASFNRPDLDKEFPAYATDIRPESDGAQEWAFDLSAKQGSQVSVHFSGIAKVPPACEVWLIDEQNGRTVDLRADSSYLFRPALAKSRFSVLVGRHGAIQDRLASALPTEFALDQNFPNPFNPSTTIPIAVPRESEVSLRVYDLLGAEVAVLQRGRLQAGRYWFTWNGTDAGGRTVATGTYLVRMQATGKTMVSKALLLK